MEIPALDWIAHYAIRHPNRIAFVDVDTGRRCTYAESHRRIGRLGTVIRTRLGAKKGDRIALLASNSSAAQEIQFACWRSGTVMLPLNWRLTIPELEFIVRDSSPVALFYGPEWERQARAVAESCGIEHLVAMDGKPSSQFETLIAETADVLPPAETSFDDPWAIFYTSGTTGRPKGAIATYGMTFFTAVNIGIEARVMKESKALVIGPTFHVGGFTYPGNCVLVWGGTVYVTKSFNAARCLALISDPAEAITHFIGVPTQMQMMAALPTFAGARFDHMTSFATGGAPVPVELMRLYAEKGAPIQQGYGMTETSAAAILMPLDSMFRKIDSTGQKLLNVALRIVDAENRDVKPGGEGELWLKGPTITPSYWNRSDANETSYVDGWFRSGDMFRADDEGFYYILDRRRDMFISGGENVYPAEVEAALRSVPGVVEAAVIGVPDEKWGKVGKAFLIRDENARISAIDVAADARTRLARYKLPKYFVFASDLPRTPSMKVAKHQLDNTPSGETVA